MPSETLEGHRAQGRQLPRPRPDAYPAYARQGARGPALARMPQAEKLPDVRQRKFVQGEFVVFRNQDRYTLTSCNIGESYYPVRLDAYRMTCGAYMLQLAQAAAHPEQEAETLYELLIGSLHRLCYNDG